MFSTRVRLWVKGPTGTEFKLERRPIHFESRLDAIGDERICRPSVIVRGNVGAQGAVRAGRTAEEREFDGEVYSLGWEDDLTLTVDIHNRMCNVIGYLSTHYRLASTVEYLALPTDPTTFILALGAGWNGAEPVRGDLAAVEVYSAFDRCDTRNEQSPVHRYYFPTTAGGNPAAVLPQITNRLNQIRALASPGDTLLVFVDAPGFLGPDDGSEDAESVNFAHHPDQETRVTAGQEGISFVPPILPHNPPLNADQVQANRAARASAPGSFTETAFASLFTGGVLDCMDKVLFNAACFSGGFNSSWNQLPFASSVGVPMDFPSSYASRATYTNGVRSVYSRAFSHALNRQPCPGAGRVLDVDRIVRDMRDVYRLGRAGPFTFIGPFARLAETQFEFEPEWSTPIGVLPVEPGFRLIASSTFRLGASCRGDFNFDGHLDPDDMADFIAAYFGPGLRFDADHDRNGTTDADDLSGFVSAYFTGCP